MRRSADPSRIPLGQIVARAQAELADQSWKDEGVTVLGLGRLQGGSGPELAPASVQALENASALAQPAQRGRPPLEEELLHRVAHAYLREAINGPGLHRRLAHLFDRPEPTIKDWIKAARERGYLSPPSRDAAQPDPARSSTTPRTGPVLLRLEPAAHGRGGIDRLDSLPPC